MKEKTFNFHRRSKQCCVLTKTRSHDTRETFSSINNKYLLLQEGMLLHLYNLHPLYQPINLANLVEIGHSVLLKNVDKIRQHICTICCYYLSLET